MRFCVVVFMTHLITLNYFISLIPIYLDGEGDNILINCEEDFRLYIEQLQAGHVTKIFFSVSPIKQQQNGEAMETEDGRSKLDRKSRKG